MLYPFLGFISHFTAFEAGIGLAFLFVYCVVRHYLKQRDDIKKLAYADIIASSSNGKQPSPQLLAAATKAREFLAETTAARGEFVDNWQLEEWKGRYSSAFAILGRCDLQDTDLDVRKAVKVFADLRGNIDQWNNDFIVSESARCDVLLGRLDACQREACVSDEVATLVVAGAGSGKTTTIQKKVEYLVRVKGIDPNDILLLSFTNKAADEMTARLAESMPHARIVASTFHKFGLEIVKAHRDGTYDVSSPNLCNDVVLRSLSPDAMTDEECRGALRFFASCANAEPEDMNKFSSLGDYIDATRSADFRTLRGMADDGKDAKTTFAGERVKSFEELEIANWLYLNGIRYEYEKKYDKPVPADTTKKYRVYKPDFYLPDYDIWIEHFGVDKNGNPPKFFSNAERIDYLLGMEWKRMLHRANNTTLVESYSWWHYKGCLTDKLWESLQKHGVTRHGINPRPVWAKLVESKKATTLREFARLVASFISLAKSRRIGPDDLYSVLANVNAAGISRVRAMRFFEIVRPLYHRYIKALEAENAIDFHDMINMASDYVRETPESIHAYKYVIIDEFQDISASRFELIRAVVKSTNAKLFCVGDDWQSIYRFAGSDISLFTEFSRNFGFARIIKLENTYRNSQELLSVAGRFIMKNPRQIKKDLKSSSHCERPVACFQYKADDGISTALHSALEEIADETKGERASVMLLGRHNQEFDWPIGVDGITPDPKVDGITPDPKRESYLWPAHPELKLSFLTVHKSKGLEADYVVILNFHDDMLGFPNMIADDPLLEILLSERECIPFAEERRVFYVALTRARRRVYILVPDVGASVFLGDISKVVQFDACDDKKDAASCPKCKKGRLVFRKGNSEFYGCTNYPRCDYTLPAQKVPITDKTLRCHCGGFLVPCHNSRNGQDFLGCTEYRRLRSILHDQFPLPSSQY